MCAHAGNDGNCGTSTTTVTTTSTTTTSTTPLSSTPYAGPFAIVAHATDLLEGHAYSRARAPRVLSGTVLAHARIAAVSLKLRRSYRGRCSAYDGTSERFVRTRCGGGAFFRVANTPSFSYLLPERLARGRYVLDIEATDTAGNRTALPLGSTRIVFYVR